jgi:hypothetical protein
METLPPRVKPTEINPSITGFRRALKHLEVSLHSMFCLKLAGLVDLKMTPRAIAHDEMGANYYNKNGIALIDTRRSACYNYTSRRIVWNLFVIAIFSVVIAVRSCLSEGEQTTQTMHKTGGTVLTH